MSDGQFTCFDSEKNLYTLAKNGSLNAENKFTGSGLIVSKYSALGRLIWRKIYTQNQPISTLGIYYTNSGLLITGSLLNSSVCGKDNFVCKLTSDGEVEESICFSIDQLTTFTNMSNVFTDNIGNIYAIIISRSSCYSNNRSMLVSFDPSLKIRYIKEIDNYFGYSSLSPIINDHFFIFLTLDMVEVGLDGNPIRDSKLIPKSGSFGFAFEGIFSNSDNIHFVKMIQQSDQFALIKFDSSGTIVKTTPYYKGIPIQKVGPFRDYYSIFANKGTECPRQFVFDSDLNLIKTQTYCGDSINSNFIAISFCPDYIKHFNLSNRLSVTEYDIYLQDPGPGITVSYSQPDSSQFSISKTTDKIHFTDRPYAISPFSLMYKYDTTFNERQFYRFPECATNNPFLIDDTLFCRNSSIQLQAPSFSPETICNSSVLNYSWNTGEKTPQITATSTGLYKIVLSHGTCQYEDSVYIKFGGYIWPLDTLYTICFEDSSEMSLDAGSLPGKWDGISENPIRVTTGGLHRFSGITYDGCPIIRDVLINDLCDEMAYLPNSFTPDGDGINDYYLPIGAALTDWNLEVYNRWGELIWKGDESSTGWDGKDKKANVVRGFYVLNFNYVEPDSQELKQLYGTLLIQP